MKTIKDLTPADKEQLKQMLSTIRDSMLETVKRYQTCVSALNAAMDNYTPETDAVWMKAMNDLSTYMEKVSAE